MSVGYLNCMDEGSIKRSLLFLGAQLSLCKTEEERQEVQDVIDSLLKSDLGEVSPDPEKDAIWEGNKNG